MYVCMYVCMYVRTGDNYDVRLGRVETRIDH